MKVMSKKELIALDNFSIIAQAKENGLRIYREDLFINYAEIDATITSIEDRAVERGSSHFEQQVRQWLERIQSKDDVDRETLNIDLGSIIFQMIQESWEYGQQAADQELNQMGIEKGSEFQEFSPGIQSFAGGKPNGEDLGNDDAYGWYEIYSRKLSAQAVDDAFVYMQPKILEHIDNGTTGKKLADALNDDFKRFGSVRTEIIARTESTKAHNWGRRYRFDQSEAIAGYRYSSIMDQRTTPICSGLHGRSWEITDAGLDQYTPPNHFRCRSILVPINKYLEWTFDPPDESWLNELEERDRNMLEKFSDSSWYPKAETVKNMVFPPNLPEVPAAPPPDQSTAAPSREIKGVKNKEAAIEDLKEASMRGSVDELREFVEYNAKRGIKRDHPILRDAAKKADDIEKEITSGARRMIRPEYAGGKTGMKVWEYDRRGDVFVRVRTKMSKEEKARVLGEIDRISDDPLFTGVKIEIKKGKGILGSYADGEDLLIYTPKAGLDIKGKQSDIATLYHEIGHRVHAGQTRKTRNGMMRTIHDHDISIDDETWERWKDTVDPFWTPGRSRIGDPELPEELANRYDYPINAKYHYKNGTKANFQKEMFAESTAVYLEDNDDWKNKVQKHYPGVLEFLEEVHQRGYIK